MKLQGTSLDLFWTTTWRMLIVLSTLTTWSSGAARLWLALVVCVLSLLQFSQFKTMIPKIGRKLIFLGVPSALATSAVIAWQGHGELVTLVAEILLAGTVVMFDRRDREIRQWLALLSLILVGIGSLIINDEAPTWLAFITFLCVAIFNLNAAKLYFLALGTREFEARLPRSYFKQLSKSLPPALIMGVAIFATLPRIRAVGIDLGLKTNNNTVGYSETINLGGQGGALSESNRVALWFKSTNPEWLKNNLASFYVRGNTMEFFDGQSWARLSTGKIEPWKETVNFAHSKIKISETQNLEVFMEPTSARSIVWPGVLLRLTPPPTMIDQLIYDVNGNISRIRNDFSRFSYSVMVAPPADPSKIMQMRRSEILAGMRNATPDPKVDDIEDGQIELLTSIPSQLGRQDWFKSWDLATSNEIYGESVRTERFDPTLGETINGINNYFAKNFRYSLENEFSDQNTLRAFLTKDRAGHCEYFASGAAAWLRGQGYAVRAVAGYRGGQWNNLSETLEILDRNAHAWLEVFVPGWGWLMVDPTPTLEVRGGLFSSARIYINAANFWFNRYVINYDYAAQRDIVRSARQFDWRKSFNFSEYTLDKNSKELVIIGILLLISLWLAFRTAKRIRLRRSKLPFWYQPILEKMRKRGLRRDLHETFQEWHVRLVAAGFDPKVIGEIDKHLEQELYALRSPTPEESKRLKQLIRSLIPPRRKVS
jgi:transglutaminase-like putative cysteine protease